MYVPAFAGAVGADERAHIKVLSARRSDTPRSISVEAFGAEV